MKNFLLENNPVCGTCNKGTCMQCKIRTQCTVYVTRFEKGVLYTHPIFLLRTCNYVCDQPTALKFGGKNFQSLH